MSTQRVHSKYSYSVFKVAISEKRKSVSPNKHYQDFQNNIDKIMRYGYKAFMDG